jgi:hypothetical protein
MSGERGVKDKRAYVRIRDQVFLRFRAIDAEEYAKAGPLCRHGMDSQWPATEVLSASRKIDLYIQRMREKDDALANILEAFDQKLDYILDILMMHMANGMPDEPYIVELSAAGMAFSYHSPVPQGQVLEIDLGLLPERSFLRCYGKVVRCEDDRRGGFAIAIEFICINNVDQDRLIEHVFKKQMAHLQLLRKERDKENP